MSASMRIAERRAKLNMTQDELSKEAGVHAQYLSALETGRRNPCKIQVDIALRLAKALRTTVEKLFA
jgi:DNA-binding XRE family transcriptional regulator